MRKPPHQIEDRHDYERCTCGWVPHGANASLLSPAADNAYAALREHVRVMDDGLCHEYRYGMDCTLPRGHAGIHQEGK